MKNISIILSLIFILTFHTIIFSQTDSTAINSEDAINDLLQESTDEIDNDQLYELFEDLKEIR